MNLLYKAFWGGGVEWAGFGGKGGRGLQTHTSVFDFAPYAFSTLVLLRQSPPR